MFSTFSRLTKGLILLGLGGLLFYKYFTGKLYYYINQRFFYLVILAAAGFLLLGYVILAYRKDHHHQHDHEHEHHHHEASNNWSFLIVAIPLLLGVVIPAKPLDANVIQSRGISNEGLFVSDNSESSKELDTPADQRTILDWIRAFNLSENPEEYTGETADVIGFVYHDPRLPDHQFLAGRLAVTCCVADAFAIGMVVDWPQAADMADNAWVHVRGQIQVINIENQTLPLIIAESVKETDPPAHPYLFP